MEYNYPSSTRFKPVTKYQTVIEIENYPDDDLRCFYPEDDSKTNHEWWILDYPNGTKKRIHVDDLKKCLSLDAGDQIDELDSIDDETFAIDLHEQVKAENFAAGIPIFYQEDDDDMNCQWYTVEYPDGTKKRVHVEDLDKII